VIGVNTAILSPNGGSIGIGFAMSATVVTRVVDQLQEFGETRRGWLGVRIQDVDAELAEALELDAVQGALITDVPPGPALEAGLQARDVILSYEGETVEDTRGLVTMVGNSDVGAVVRVVVFRDGGTQTILVTLGRREEAERAVPASAPVEEVPTEQELMGLTVGVVDDQLRAELGLPDTASGLVVKEVDEASEAFAKGLRVGDLITEAGQTEVSSLVELEEKIAAAKAAGQKSLLLLIRRGGDPRFVALSLG